MPPTRAKPPTEKRDVLIEALITKLQAKFPDDHNMHLMVLVGYLTNVDIKLITEEL